MVKIPKISKKESHKTEKEKLEERREEVLAQGRKFKYPLQYAKHRLVFITVVLGILALVGSGTGVYVALYKVQDTSDVLYRLTTVLPLSVARADGASVRYSDYLMIYRSSITPVEQQNGAISENEDAEGMIAYYKRTALNSAEDYSYAMKLADELGIKITDEMIDKSFEDHRTLGGSERSKESFLKVLKDNFGLSESEYRRMLYMSLAKMEVEKTIDSEAADKMDRIATAISEIGKDGSEWKDKSWPQIAEAFGASYEETGDLVDIKNVDGGRATVAYKLESEGSISEKFVSTNGDGYYIVKLEEKKDGQVSYMSIKVDFSEFDRRVAKLREEGKIQEFITISEESDSPSEGSDDSEIEGEGAGSETGAGETSGSGDNTGAAE